MALTVNSGLATSDQTAAASSLTVSTTIPAGTTLLIAMISVGTLNSRTVSGITYNGVAMTKQATVSSSGITEIWTLDAPTVGTNNTVATLSGVGSMVLTIISINGTYVLGANGTNSGTGSTATQTTATTGTSGYVFAALNYNGGTGNSYTGSGSNIASQTVVAQFSSGAAYETFTASANPSETWNRDSGSADWSTAYIEVDAVNNNSGFFFAVDR